jgi:hypothetical protein
MVNAVPASNARRRILLIQVPLASKLDGTFSEFARGHNTQRPRGDILSPSVSLLPRHLAKSGKMLRQKLMGSLFPHARWASGGALFGKVQPGSPNKCDKPVGQPL